MVLNNIFGEIPEDVLAFVIDTSLSMEGLLPIVRKHLEVKLSELVARKHGSKFNIIATSSKVMTVCYFCGTVL